MVWKSIRLKNVLIIFLSTRYDRYLLKLRREREKEKEKKTQSKLEGEKEKIIRL